MFCLLFGVRDDGVVVRVYFYMVWELKDCDRLADAWSCATEGACVQFEIARFLCVLGKIREVEAVEWFGVRCEC